MAKENRLLIISYPFPPNSSAGAVRSRRFAQYLTEFGWQVSVITIKSYQNQLFGTEELSCLNDIVDVHFTSTIDPWLSLRSKSPNLYTLRILRSLLMKIFSFPDHMLLWVPFAVMKGLFICRKNQISAIYTTSPPHSTHLAGLILKWLTGKPWIADFRDPWTLNAYRPKEWVQNVLLRVEKYLEEKVLKNASRVLANTAANRSNLLAAFPQLPADKVVYMPNGWEEIVQTPTAGSSNGPFTIVHAGTFYPRFKPYALFYALAEWRNGKNHPDVPPMPENIQVVVLGARDNDTKQIIEELALSDIVQLKPWLSQADAQAIMCRADLLWATLGTGKESSTYVPSKLFEYIASGRPIIGYFPEGEAQKLITETGTGIVIMTDEPTRTIYELNRLISCRDKIWNSICFRDENRINDYNIKYIVSRLADILIKETSSQYESVNDLQRKKGD